MNKCRQCGSVPVSEEGHRCPRCYEVGSRVAGWVIDLHNSGRLSAVLTEELSTETRRKLLEALKETL